MVSSDMTRLAFALSFGLALLGCKPDLEGGASLIDSPRVLAIRSEPAEAAPKSNPPVDLTWTVLYVGPNGDEDPSKLDWGMCVERKPLATAGEISPACLVPSGDALLPMGNGESVTGRLPEDGCRQFGPNPPLPAPGEPTPRPTDPDATGGFYQPLRIASYEADGYDYSVGLTRISCGIARVSSEQTIDYQRRYRANQNPELEAVVANPGRGDEALTNDGDTTVVVRTNAKVTFRASWPTCPTTPSCGDGFCGAYEDKATCVEDCTKPRGCGGSEPFVAFDLGTRELVDRREAMRVSWYATDGVFEHDRSGRSAADASVPFSDDTWTAPNHPGDVRVWVVLRDERGGTDFAAYVVRVE